MNGVAPALSSVSRRGVPTISPLGRTAPGSAAERWARLVFNTMTTEIDPKTVGLWAKSIGLSRSSLCEYCRLLHVLPHDARDFGRLLRAIYRSGPKWEPEAVLDLADARTLKKLLARAGLAHGVVATPTPLEFIDRQQWIPSNNPGLMILRRLVIESRDFDAVKG